MSLLLKLYLAFFKIGIFGFGGGYAMISLIQDILIFYGWLSMKKFIDIIAIAEMTPGPIAINSGTFVGYKVASFSGALAATLGVITPSFILIIILAHFFNKVKDSTYMERIMQFLRPVVIALIFAAAYHISESSFVDWKSILIAGIVFISMLKTKISPILMIALSGVAGIILY